MKAQTALLVMIMALLLASYVILGMICKQVDTLVQVLSPVKPELNPIDSAIIKLTIMKDREMAYESAIVAIDREIHTGLFPSGDENFVRSIYYLTGIKPPTEEGRILKGWLSLDQEKRIAYWKKIFPQRKPSIMPIKPAFERKKEIKNENPSLSAFRH
jgi:hypothetical protein